MSCLNILRSLCLISFFGLMINLLVWILLAQHSEKFPIAAWLIIGVVPLLFPMRGILYARPYTHAWASFLMLFYIAHAIGEIYSGDAVIWYPFIELIFSSVFFIAANLYVRTAAKLRKSAQT